jgi:hypothetical protein
MLCTRLQADDDYFDLHKPNKNFHFSAQEPPAGKTHRCLLIIRRLAHLTHPPFCSLSVIILDMLYADGALPSPASDRFSEQDAEYAAYLSALVNAPMLDLTDLV